MSESSASPEDKSRGDKIVIDLFLSSRLHECNTTCVVRTRSNHNDDGWHGTITLHDASVGARMPHGHERRVHGRMDRSQSYSLTRMARDPHQLRQCVGPALLVNSGGGGKRNRGIRRARRIAVLIGESVDEHGESEPMRRAKLLINGSI